MTTLIYARWAPPKPAIKKKPPIAPSPPAPAPNPPTESPAKKPKKRKRESKVDEQVEIEDRSTPKKHKAILSKFEKSSKLVEAARASAKLEPEEEDEEETAPAEVLHGGLQCSISVNYHANPMQILGPSPSLSLSPNPPLNQPSRRFQRGLRNPSPSNPPKSFHSANWVSIHSS